LEVMEVMPVMEDTVDMEDTGDSTVDKSVEMPNPVQNNQNAIFRIE